MQKRTEEALEASERTVKINPEDPVLLYWRGVILEVAEMPLKALECYERGPLEVDPRNPELWECPLGNLLSELGRMDDAIES